MSRTNRCLYDNEIEKFLKEDPDKIFGIVVSGAHGPTLTTARDAWLEEISFLQNILKK